MAGVGATLRRLVPGLHKLFSDTDPVCEGRLA